MTVLAASSKSVFGGDFAAIVHDSNSVMLWTGNTGASNYATLQESDGLNVGYQVPTGKTLFIPMIIERADQANQSILFVGYGDNDVGRNTATAPTNNTNCLGGGALLGGNPIYNFTFTAIGEFYQAVAGVLIPAGKFPAIANSGAHSGNYFLPGRLI